MSINNQLEQSQKEYGGNTNSYFKFAPGENRIRILSAGEIIATHFFGKGQKASTCYGYEKGCPFHGDKAPKDDKGQIKRPSIKYTCYVLSNGEILIADLPYSVIKQVGELQANVDYSFDEFPMPYDITVKFNPDSNSPNDMYKVIPSPKREAISDDTQEQLLEKITKLNPKDSVEKKKQWQIAEHEKTGMRLKVGATREELEKAAQKSKEVMEDEAFAEYPDNEIKPEDIPF